MAQLHAELAIIYAGARGPGKIGFGYSASASRIVPPRQFGLYEIVIADLLPETTRPVRGPPSNAGNRSRNSPLQMGDGCPGVQAVGGADRNSEVLPVSRSPKRRLKVSVSASSQALAFQGQEAADTMPNQWASRVNSGGASQPATGETNEDNEGEAEQFPSSTPIYSSYITACT